MHYLFLTFYLSIWKINSWLFHPNYIFLIFFLNSFLQTMEIKGLQALLISRPLQFGQIFLYSLSIWTLVTIQMVQCRHHEISNLQSSSSNQQLGSEQISPLDTINDSKCETGWHVFEMFYFLFCILIEKLKINIYLAALWLNVKL